MPELFLIENHTIQSQFFSASNEAVLHKDLQELLFKHKKVMCNIFENIRGTFLIDHMAIITMDIENTIMIFSSTPSVEYNLISQELWRHDKSFSLNYQTENRFYAWEKAYEELYFEKLKMIKQTQHGFTFGFNLSKKIESMQLVYSFATRQKKSDILEYYRRHIHDLFAIGDYCYKGINELSEKYSKKITPMTPNENKTFSFSPFLKLINSKK